MWRNCVQRQKFLEIYKICKNAAAIAAAIGLSLAEGLAVGALIHGRVGLMGTNHDLIQGAVVFSVAVVSAGLDGAFNALIGMAIHILFLLLFLGTQIV